MKDVWRNVENFEGLYQVSNFGRVRSMDRYVTRKQSGRNLIKGRTLSAAAGKRRYPRVTLCDGERKEPWLVHRLVAIAFLEPDDSRPQVNHKDGDRHNNHVSNLEWCTHAENMRHAGTVLGVMGGRSGPGEKCPAAKLTDTDVARIKSRLLLGEAIKTISLDYPVGPAAISDIKAGRSWRHIRPEDMHYEG
jgi:hypothetical protein